MAKYQITKRTSQSRVTLIAWHGDDSIASATTSPLAKGRIRLVGSLVTEDTATSEAHALTLLKEIVAKHKDEQKAREYTEEVLWEDDGG